MLDNGTLFSIYNYSTAITAALLAVLYLLAVFRIKRTSEDVFVLKLSILLFISNVAAMLVVWANLHVAVWFNQKHPIAWIYVQGISAVIRDVCFNLAHWVFAY